MQATVNKQESGVFFNFPQIQKNLAGQIGERKTETIGRLVYPAIFFVECPRLFVADKNQRQIVFLAQNFFFYPAKRRARRRAFGRVGD
jgi:hypothetical protein